MAYKDLREFIKKLEEEGELHRIKKEVDWNIELGTIMRKVFDLRGPAVLFEKVKGSNITLLSGAMDTYKRYALGIGESSQDLRSLLKKVLEATKNPIKPVLVKDGVCKENMEKGKDIDLYKFPVPKWHELDGGRFIGTLGVVITRDPETGVRNVGIYRQQLHGKNKTGLMALQQLGLMFEKYSAMKKPMPIVTAIGVDPAILAASVCAVGYGEDELGIAGGLRGAPVELVKCETVDLEVPANAEIVLEGYIPFDESEWEEEGPFGEFPGYYGGLKAKRPVVNLTAVTYRNNPVFQGTFEGKPPSESTTIRAIGHTVGEWDKLLKSGVPGVKDVLATDMGCAAFIIVVSMDRHYYGGNARQIMEAIWATSNKGKWVIVVDDDIDIYDREQVEWALATRVQPHRDIVITSDRESAINLDPSVDPSVRDYPVQMGSRIGIDATIYFKGYKFPPIARPTEEQMREIENKWKEYGFGKGE